MEYIKKCKKIYKINEKSKFNTIEELKEKHNSNDLEEVFVNLIGGEEDYE